jgi:Holliday junction resolvase
MLAGITRRWHHHYRWSLYGNEARETMAEIDPDAFPLARFFLSGYLANTIDPTNFPGPDLPTILGRYETLFANALRTLGVAKHELRQRTEFNFDSGDAANLEGGIAILRTSEALRLRGFSDIRLVSPRKGEEGADLVGRKNGAKVCVEVKAVTKQSRARQGLFLEDQLYEKVREHATKAARQLSTSASVLGCKVKMLAYVVNWFDQSIYLDESDYQAVVNKLERHGEVESLLGIDAVLFVTKMGQDFLFLSNASKQLDI